MVKRSRAGKPFTERGIFEVWQKCDMKEKRKYECDSREKWKYENSMEKVWNNYGKKYGTYETIMENYGKV